MKKLLVALFFILLAVWVGFLIHKDSGYVMIAYAGYTIETSLWVFLISLIILFSIAYFLIRLIKNTAGLGGRYHNWSEHRKADKARELTNKGLCELAEGNWKEARLKLTKAAKHHPDPLINYLAAARAAHFSKEYDARDEDLRHAHESTKGCAVAVGLTQATLQIEGKQWEQAAATLHHLNSISSNHKYITKLLCSVYLKLQDWNALKTLLPQIKRTKAYSDAAYDSIDRQVYIGLLQNTTPEQLHEAWDQLPKKWRNDPIMLRLHIDQLLKTKNYEEAADLISKCVKKSWDPVLISDYGLAPTENINKQISIAESWLEKHPNEPELLLCIGRLCLKGNLLGRAEHVLESCVSLSPTPDSYLALGKNA